MPGKFPFRRPPSLLRGLLPMIGFACLPSQAEWRKVFAQPGAFVESFLQRGDSLFAMVYSPDTLITPRGFSLSLDHGKTWQPFRKGVEAAEFGGVVGNAGDLYGIAVSGLQVMRWSGDRDGWIATRGNPPEPILLGGIGTSVVALTRNRGVYHSADRGETWTLADFPPPGITAVQRFFSSGTSLFVHGWGSDGIYRTEDEGRTWNRLNASLGLNSYPYFAAMGRLLFLTQGAELLRSDDDGESWTPVNTNPLPGFDSLSRFKQLCACGDRLYSTSGLRFFLSQDSGSTWKPTGEILPVPVSDFTCSGPELVATLTDMGPRPVVYPSWSQYRPLEEMIPTSVRASKHGGKGPSRQPSGRAGPFRLCAYDLRGRMGSACAPRLKSVHGEGGSAP